MTKIENIPKIIQGGMGAGISNWKLAKSVSTSGGLGIVAGTALDQILVRRLQNGDDGGHMRRALEAFPVSYTACKVLAKWFQPGGKPTQKYRLLSKPNHKMSQERIEIIIVAAFAEVFLAKEGHGNPVGFNCLEKLQLPLVPSIFGAMLAGVDMLTIGAGLPMYIPKVLDSILSLQPLTIPLHVEGKTKKEHYLDFNPTDYFPKKFSDHIRRLLKRPLFFPIISSVLAGKMLLRKNVDSVDGFIVESHLAGGHNAPPRKKNAFLPSYGKKDEIDIAAIGSLQKPFWLAGGYSTPPKFQEAIQAGASGVQVGTLFAYCEQSGLDPVQKNDCKKMCIEGRMKVKTDFHASPTGYPFKTVQKEGTMTVSHATFARNRMCDLGYLRTISESKDGSLRYNCPATSPDSKALCVCNGLMAAAGLAQAHSKTKELPLLTCGEETNSVVELISISPNYTAQDALNFINGTLRKRLTA